MAQVQHATLVAATVTTMTFTDGLPNIEVYAVDGASPVYFTVDGSAPTVTGTNCFCVADVKGTALSVPEESGGSTVTVKLISAATPKVSVRSHA